VDDAVMTITKEVSVDLRARYREALATVAGRVGAVDRTVAGQIALGRVHRVLGVAGGRMTGAAKEADIRRKLLEYVIAMRAVLSAYVQASNDPENLVIVAELEREVGGLIV